MKKFIFNIKALREYLDNEISPLNALCLRKANRQVMIGSFISYVFLLFINTVILFCILPEWDLNVCFTCTFFFVGIFAEFLAVCNANPLCLQDDPPYRGDETLRLIPIPFLDRFHACFLMPLFLGLSIFGLTLPFVILTVIVDWNNAVLLFIPLAQLGLLYAALLLTPIFGCLSPIFRKPWERLLHTLSFLGIAATLFVAFHYLDCQTFRSIQKMNRQPPDAPVIFISAAVMSALFFQHVWSAISYFLIRYYLTHPRLRFLKVLGINLAVHVSMFLLILITAAVLLLFY